MTMYLLDTNIVSMLDPHRHVKAPGLLDWLERNGGRLYLSVMTIAEIEAGVTKLRRAGKFEHAEELSKLIGAILADFGERVLPIDCETAREVAKLAGQDYRHRIGLPDVIIAATAVRHGLVLLTRNLGELSRLGIAARDPFDELPPDV
jgi:predicted nucleic acid-binding protein